MTRIVALALALAFSLPTRAVERSEIPDRYRWNLADLYASDDAWTVAREEVGRSIPAFAARRGRLGESARSLADALDELFALDLR
ncbi:MAG: oligoendopeptidase, partial [Anaeromyxobacteraceae bacterium]|nr:oligoendopeptidase [Anaeromyxobacteraceae bacterium]